MPRPQFPRRRTQPMRPDSYLRIARLLRDAADRIERSAPGADRHQKQSLTTALQGLRHQARDWWERHQATADGTLRMPPRPLGGPRDEA